MANSNKISLPPISDILVNRPTSFPVPMSIPVPMQQQTAPILPPLPSTSRYQLPPASYKYYDYYYTAPPPPTAPFQQHHHHSISGAPAQAARSPLSNNASPLYSNELTPPPATLRHNSTNTYNIKDESELDSPTSGGPGKRKTRNNLPKQTTYILLKWLNDHLNHPYPNSFEKNQLMMSTGLNQQQLSNWFINARRRKIKSLKEQKRLNLV